MTSVLVVEDHEAVRVLVSRVAESLGYEVTVADGAAAAREAAEREARDLLVTDVSLGDGSGLELGRWVRERHPSTRVLYVSGHEARELARLAEREGAPPPGAAAGEAVLHKPFSLAELRAAVQELVAG